MRDKKKVLLVGTLEKSGTVFKDVFPAAQYEPLECVHTPDQAKRLLAAENFDMVMIKESPGQPCIQAAAQMAASFQIPVLLMVRPEIYDQACYQLQESLVFVTMLPAERSFLSQSVAMLEKVASQIRKLELQLKKERQKLRDEKTVFHCKLMLVEDYHWPEEKAHRYIEKSAMDHSLSKAAVARILLEKSQQRKGYV